MNAAFFRDDHLSDRPFSDGMSKNGRSTPPSSATSILIIEDNSAVARSMQIAFRIAGYDSETAPTLEEAYSRLASTRYDAILLDMNFSPGQSSGAEGLECLKRLIADDPSACVIVITAHSGIRIAVAAMQAGARDFVMKPWRNNELIEKVNAAVANGTTSAMIAPKRSPSCTKPARLLGESPAIQRVRDIIHRIGPTGASVSITGPSGSGRTLAAMAIHALSADANAAPRRINLGDDAAWADLDENSGTIVLRLPEHFDAVRQARLLDRLPPSVRCLAIAESVTALVPALQERIATVEIPVPPLNRRGDDAVILARHFAREAAERFSRSVTGLSEAAEAAVSEAIWTDNVRGLKLAIERAVLLAESEKIDIAAPALSSMTNISGDGEPVSSFDLLDAEKAMIEAALRKHRHNVTHAAHALGLSRGTLYRRMARHGL